MSKEQWNPILGYEEEYSVSSYGRVKRDKKSTGTFPGRILKSSKNPRYLVVSLRKNGNIKSFTVHRLVALAFLGLPKEGQVVNHIDFNRYNNNVNNLEYVSIKQNVNHTRNANRHSFGSIHGRTKLTEEMVIEIRNKRKNGVKTKELSLVYSVSKDAIRRIVRRNTWKHI